VLVAAVGLRFFPNMGFTLFHSLVALAFLRREATGIFAIAVLIVMKQVRDK